MTGMNTHRGRRMVGDRLLRGVVVYGRRRHPRPRRPAVTGPWSG
jgi:hypothetical protein